MTTTTDELTAAAATMRRFNGPAAEPIAKLLDGAAEHCLRDSLCCDHGYDSCSEIAAPALAVARAINGSLEP